MHEAKLQFEATGRPSRVFKDFTYQTRKSWSRERRVVGKAEHLAKGSNPRFVVTSLSAEELDARTLYEDVYCARGEMENRIKEQQLCLFADRTSCATMRANQLRLWLSSVAYTLAGGVAAVRPARHGDGAGALRHDPVEAVEIGSVGADHGSSGVDFVVGELPVSTGVCPGVREPATVVVAAAGLGIRVLGPPNGCFPKTEFADGLRRKGLGRCKTARRPHQWLPRAAASRRFALHRSRRARRVARRVVGRGYAAGW